MLPDKPKDYAKILCFSKADPFFGEPILTFKWEGALSAPVELRRFDNDLLAHPNFPFKLKLIDRDFYGGTNIYVRTDTPINLKLIQFLEHRWFQHCKAFNYFQGQIILTLHIWGLAYVSPHEIPSWGCVGKHK